MICTLCPLCLQPYGAHTDACGAPRPKPPAPTPAQTAERVEKERARAIAAWLGGGTVPVSAGRHVPEERPLP